MPVSGSDLDAIAPDDRGLAYGDGLFETIRIHRHRLLLPDLHLDRLARGAEHLRIAYDRNQLAQDVQSLGDRFPEWGVLKILLTRGSGGRGYRPAPDNRPRCILTLHPLPDYGDSRPEEGVEVFVCRQRLALQPALAGLKHLNRLEQVLASLEWPDDSLREGLMLDMEDNVIEGTRSNLFWAEGGTLHTPALDRCGVDGVMRQHLMHELGHVQQTRPSPLAKILGADEVFLCNSVFGVWPVTAVHHDGRVTIAGSPENGKYTALAKLAFERLLDMTAHG